MRYLVLVALFVGCVDSDDEVPGCDPELTLTSGSQETLELELRGGEARDLCVLLDARASETDVELIAEAPFFPNATELELRDNADTVLTSDDEVTGELHWVIAPHTRSAVTLTTTAAHGISALGVELRIKFSEVAH